LVQSIFTCVIGFDYYSSGTTTFTCGALKEAIAPEKYVFLLQVVKERHPEKHWKKLKELENKIFECTLFFIL